MAAIKEADGVLYIASGETDGLAYRSAGIKNVISWFGEDAPPSTLPDDFRALGVREVRYLPDRDDTGQRSARKVARLLQGSGITYTVFELPSELGEKGDINRLWQTSNFDQVVFLSHIEEIIASREVKMECTDMTETSEPLCSDADRRERSGSGFQNSVDWQAEQRLWVQTIVESQLDAVAPVQRQEGSRERRHCPNPAHPDHDPSFSISYDRDTEIGIPQCSCGIQNKKRPWDIVAEWTGAEPFKSWWKRERKHLYSERSNGHHGKKRQMVSVPTASLEADRKSSSSTRKRPAPDTKQLTKDLAEAILADEHFARDTGGKLYYFCGGVYQPGGERRIEQYVKTLLNAWKMNGQWTTHRANEVVAYILVDAPQLWETPPLDMLNVKNGLIDTATLRLTPHRPDFLSQIQLPVEYVPGAYPDNWDEFCRTVFPPDAYEAGVHWQIVAWLMLSITSLQKALLLLGDGGNGKSRFLAGVRAFLGSQHITALSLQKLENDRFAVARLLGKLANICPDLPSQHLEQTATFKLLTGDDGRLTGEFKGKDSFEFAAFARLVFSTNQPPISKDNSEGFYRRWIVIHFTQVFTGSNRIDSRQIDARLTAPEELSGVLNMALKYLPQVIQHGITETPSMKQALGDFREITDPLAVWLEQETFLDETVYISQDALWQAYHREVGPMTKQMFGREFKRLRPQVETAQRMWGGKQKAHVYLGVGCRSVPFKPLA